MEDCQLETSLHDGLLTVKILHQQITGSDLPKKIGDKLTKALLLDEVRVVLLDFRFVEHFSSNFVGELIVFKNKCTAKNIRVAVCSLLAPIRTLFSIVNLTSMFEIVESEDEAIQRMSQSIRHSNSKDGDINELRAKAESGDADSQYVLAVCLEEGDLVVQDQVKAFEMYLLSASNGNAEAQYNVGKAFAYGIVVDPNFQEAIDWYTKAANQGHCEAQYALGIENHFGLSSDPNPTEARRWFILSSAQGHKAAADYLRKTGM